MGVEVALSVIQTLLSALQCSNQFTEFSSIFGYKPQLDQLSGTVARIKAVLLDAETKQELSQEEKVYIEELKDALYEADDLFDEFLTLAQCKELTTSFKDRYFSVFKKPGFALRMSQKVDKIKKKLDAIAYNNQLIRFEHSNNFKHDPESIKKRRPDTCSYVRSVDIIGREADLEKIVGVLLQSDVQQNVSFLSIVGIGGLGKTALAQLVFNDPRVTAKFPLKLWTCVSDVGQRHLDVEGILNNILASVCGVKNKDATMDQVQNDIRKELAANRYLLVLDDVWTEDREQWSQLTSFLMEGQRGSRILVTTRSRITARIIDGGSMHELQGLSTKDSWQLFKRMALGYEQSNPPRNLLEIGQKIVVQCANVPLAIRVMGSLLYGQDKREWLSIQKYGLTKMGKNNNGIIPILILSYQQLPYPLKSCFGYCAIFPKDCVMKKKTLMRLWMAQGYINPDDHKSMEDVAEEFFTVLLRRCFFQDIQEDEFGDIDSCKMHDLMHDIAQEVVGKEIYLGDTFNGYMDEKVRHVHITSCKPIKYNFTKSRVRSFIQKDKIKQMTIDKFSSNTLLEKWKYLRVLCLIRLDVKNSFSSIGDLLHLRYLDFSYNELLELLPKEITKLYNLQSLVLKSCYNLKELPKDMSKLVKLRVLDIKGCTNLTFMPIGIGKLESLQELTFFVVGEADFNGDKALKNLEDLKALRNLKGSLEIKMFWEKNGIEKGGGGGYLQNKEHLNQVLFIFRSVSGERRVEYDEAIIKELQPHSNVRHLDIWYYQGVRTPIWWQEGNLANLVKLDFHYCLKLKCLGCVGNLYHLKHLYLYKLQDLEFLIDKNTRGHYDTTIVLSSSSTLEFSYFPSLETLGLKYMPKLKKWWKGVGMVDDYQLLLFPQLRNLQLLNCPELIASVECPALEYLDVRDVNTKFEIISIREKKDGKEKVGEPTPLTTDPSLKVRELIIDNVKWVNSLQHIEGFPSLCFLQIKFDKEVESLEEGGKFFHSCSSSLRFLLIMCCSKLRSVCEVLEHLPALETLSIDGCHNLWLSEEKGKREEGSDMPCQSINHSLCTLDLHNLPHLVNLPNWIKNLTNLQTLLIWNCERLESLPNWLCNLTSLKKLNISRCSNTLEERCRHSTGEDWPHIKHISTIHIS